MGNQAVVVGGFRGFSNGLPVVDPVRVTGYERELAKQLQTAPTDMEKTYRGRVSLTLLRGPDATS